MKPILSQQKVITRKILLDQYNLGNNNQLTIQLKTNLHIPIDNKNYSKSTILRNILLLKILTSQYPQMIKAKKNISSFKVRKNNLLGLAVSTPTNCIPIDTRNEHTTTKINAPIKYLKDQTKGFSHSITFSHPIPTPDILQRLPHLFSKKLRAQLSIKMITKKRLTHNFLIHYLHYTLPKW